MGKNAAIILAAGKGTRMKSSKAKVLHEICGKPMIGYVVDEAGKVADEIIVIVGHQREEVKGYLKEVDDLKFAVQKEQLGTGHAVKCAVPEIGRDVENIMILCGDAPLVKADTLKNFFISHENNNNDMTVLASYIENPKGYGRIILDNDKNVTDIVEESDASEDEKKINLINTGVYCVRKERLLESIEEVNSDNAQGEFYLPDIVGILFRQKRKIGFDICEDFSEILGVNDIKDLSVAQSIMESRVTN